MTNSGYFIGLISGTSVDGIDCALVRFHDEQPELIETVGNKFPQDLRDQILALCGGKNIDLQTYGSVDNRVGNIFADSVDHVLDKANLKHSEVSGIGSHGQTVFHEPAGEFPFTLQLGDPNIIAQRTGITTVADFRRRDMAVGGEGAPLAPLLHRNCFNSEQVERVIVNIGGISNITVLQGKRCFAFDTGPGNVLMDYWIGKHQNKSFDAGGEWAAKGSVDEKLLDQLLDEEYFTRAHPKSTGRELFNNMWLEQHMANIDLKPEDIQATLLELTASTIASAITTTSKAGEVYVCGGGAQNDTLMQRLSCLLPDCQLGTTELLGVHPDWVEATAFAWMAKQTLAGKPIDTTAVTGAREAVILGGIYQA